MPGEAEVGESPEAVFYGQHYARIDSELAAEIRREVFDEDFGQESWRSAAEQAEIADLLRLTSDSRALDVACGAGGPSLALAERWGCFVTGLDIEPEGIAHANAEGARRGFTARVSFAAVDCAGPLPFADDSFDAILCIDAISHLPDRLGALLEWRRLLRGGGRLVFTDPLVVTGPIAKSEIDGRLALGYNGFFVPPGFNEEILAAAGLTLLSRRDRAAAVAEIAARWRAARERRAELLKREEGEEWFERRQRMLTTSAELAEGRRLSRFLYLAEKAS